MPAGRRRLSGESQARAGYLRGSLDLGGHSALDGRQRLLGTRGFRAACLSHVGAATAALAAQRFGAATDELDRVEAARQIWRYPDHNRRLPVGARDDRDDTGANLTLQIVG